jgi:hypothetical protein
VVVNERGEIRFPPIKSMSAMGLTISELEDALAVAEADAQEMQTQIQAALISDALELQLAEQYLAQLETAAPDVATNVRLAATALPVRQAGTGVALLIVVTVAGALVFLLAHSLAKAGLFLCVGIIEHRTHTKDIRELGGLARRMPVTTVSFILCALTIVGFPPTAGFYGKFMIIVGLVEGGHLPAAILAVAGALLSLMYLLRLFSAAFLGEDRWPTLTEGTPIMLAVVAAFAGLSLAAGLAATPLLNLASGIAAQMLR